MLHDGGCILICSLPPPTGGAIFVLKGNVTLQDCKLQGNTADISGAW